MINPDTRPCTSGPDGGTCDGTDHVRRLIWSCFTAAEQGVLRDAAYAAGVTLPAHSDGCAGGCGTSDSDNPPCPAQDALTPASLEVLAAQRRVIEQLRELAFPDLVGQPIEQAAMRRLLALVEQQAVARVQSTGDAPTPDGERDCAGRTDDCPCLCHVLAAKSGDAPTPDALREWTHGHHALAERMHEAWELTGRPDPFDHDMEAWRGFALVVKARESVVGSATDHGPDLRRLATAAGGLAATGCPRARCT